MAGGGDGARRDGQGEEPEEEAEEERPEEHGDGPEEVTEEERREEQQRRRGAKHPGNRGEGTPAETRGGGIWGGTPRGARAVRQYLSTPVWCTRRGKFLECGKRAERGGESWRK